MKLLANGNQIISCNTGYKLSPNSSLYSRNDKVINTNVYLDHSGVDMPGRCGVTKPEGEKASPVRLSNERYREGWNRIFASREDRVAIHIEDNEFEDVGIVYKGRDDVEISIRRNKMNGVGVVALTAPGGAVLVDGKRVVELPLPEKFTQQDLNELIQIVKSAKAKGEDAVLEAKTSPSWKRWLGYSADAATLLTAIAAALSQIIT